MWVRVFPHSGPPDGASFPVAAVTNGHKQDGLKQQNVSPPSQCGDQESEVQQGCGSGGGAGRLRARPPPALRACLGLWPPPTHRWLWGHISFGPVCRCHLPSPLL